jgi:hypothetical protein
MTRNLTGIQLPVIEQQLGIDILGTLDASDMRTDWMTEDALCAHAITSGRIDADAWYPVGQQGRTPKLDDPLAPQAAQAIAICGACPLREACALHGLRHEKDGIWGGLTPIDRGVIRRSLGADPLIRATYDGFDPYPARPQAEDAAA